MGDLEKTMGTQEKEEGGMKQGFQREGVVWQPRGTHHGSFRGLLDPMQSARQGKASKFPETLELASYGNS